MIKLTNEKIKIKTYYHNLRALFAITTAYYHLGLFGVTTIFEFIFNTNR